MIHENIFQDRIKIMYSNNQTRIYLESERNFSACASRDREIIFLLLKITAEFRSNQVKSIEEEEEEAPIKRDIDTHGSEFSSISGCKKFHQGSPLDCFKRRKLREEKSL